MQPDHYAFDLFDTLITRPLREPHELFFVMEILLTGRHPELQGFAKKRRKAELRARRQSKNSEVRLEEIYEHLLMPQVKGLRQPVNEYLQTIEKNLELACTLPVNARIDLYKNIVSQSASTFIVSDTYFDREFVSKLLSQNSIPRPSHLYISSEYLKSKSRGDLWQLIRKEHLGTILHTGDNAYSDHIAAQNHGVESLLVPRTCDKFRPLPRSANAKSLKLFFSQLAKERFDSYWARLGFALMGPTLVEFSRYLMKTKENTNSDRIIFLARDGYIVKRAFDRLYPSNSFSEYMFASRRMLNFPRIKHIDSEAKKFLLSGTTRQSFRAYLERVNVPTEAAEDFLSSNSCKLDQLVSSFSDHRILERLFEHLEPKIVKIASAERAYLNAYFKRLGFLDKHCLVVDVGWHGSLQRSINALTKEFVGVEKPVHGAYFGLFHPNGKEARKHSFFIRNRFDEFIVRRGVELIELLFAGPELPIKTVDGAGNAIRFDANEKEIERIEICKDLIRGLDTFFDFFEQAQIGALDTDFQGYTKSYWRQLVMIPTRESLKHFGPVPHSEGFGNQFYRTIVAPNYRDSYWKLGYLASKIIE